MADTTIFALVGALALTLTLVPVLCATFLRGGVHERRNVAFEAVRAAYARTLDWCLAYPRATVLASIGLFAASLLLTAGIGAEFMTPVQLGVTLLGLAAIGWINWYFFVAGRAAVAATTDRSGAQRIRIEVKGGYEPAVVRVRAGAPVRLEFHRDETNPCTEEVVLPDFGIRTFLPAHQTTSVGFTPAPGRYEFSCGMGMATARPREGK